ncbi:MAG TPA: hypothetical protein VN176_00190 [Verrucomicrobiae bacterium]|jgi:hypothetical protein|nr:hypothetical protein [Verrucomicrobiae bacterium]
MTKTKNAIICAVVLWSATSFAWQKRIESLKAQVEGAHGAFQAKLCAELADELVPVASQQFSEGNSELGQATVKDILKYATTARDVSISTRGKMKEIEILLRQTQRRLEGLKRTLSVDDRPPLDEVEKKLEQFRQDILNEMFAPPKKEKK